MSDAENVGKPGREYSTVQFPYSSMVEALAVADAIAKRGGAPLSREQLAAALDQKQASGAFTTKVAAARMFGFIEDGPSSRLKVSALGFEALAAEEGLRRPARVAAFMNVELYRKLYEGFRGRLLPARPLGLEEAIVALGVSPKQKTNARLAFEKSAQLAGFFDHGNDRLVEPLPVAPSAAPDTSPETGTPTTVAPVEREQQRVKLDPVIEALISKLPFKGPWSTSDRKAWLTMMGMAFDMAYGPDVSDPPRRAEPISLERDKFV